VLPSEAIVNYENKNYIFIDKETSSLKWSYNRNIRKWICSTWFESRFKWLKYCCKGLIHFDENEKFRGITVRFII
jgi:hypothetical protein